ncbi:hypothetical protein F7734_50570 [Scytonema sp. UIC 10036]|uniref:hypothetical protein n=1 Tax=Scytonema sp. UIC 10036 TaxID=2304196 RepID=UPI0012DA874D|nr:hypothetical protein [Scytonema sp. UIC 10036]MUH00087.1 hypothetical protein [Scytonema sp. UIC 10036]
MGGQMKAIALKKNNTSIQLQEIDRKMQKGAFITEIDNHLFNHCVNTSYGSALIAKIVLPIGEDSITFKSPALRSQLQLQILRHPKKTVPFWAIQPSRLNRIPTEDDSREPLRLMLTPYTLLPKKLNKFQAQQLSQLEFLLKYAAAYIIRKRYRENFCSLPTVDNRSKPFCDAWADRWYRILNLCSLGMDFLSDREREKIPKSWNWLDILVQEHRRTQLLELSADENPIVPKYEQANYWDTYADYLRKRKVPPSINSKEHPSLFRLLDISTQTIGEALTDYIDSIERFAQQIRENSMVTSVGFSSKGLILRERRGK